MTLILTFLANEYIVQIADRRLTWPNGSLYDDDTNKAVFFCSRVAVAYTGLAQLEGKPTAEWISLCMKDYTQTESAMNHIATRVENYFQGAKIPDKRLAIVATGWATVNGKLPIRRFVSVASNFMSEGWQFGICDKMKVHTRLLDEDQSAHLFIAGQPLYPRETAALWRQIRRAAKKESTILGVVRLLQSTVQSVADRNGRVGKGMITHLLSRSSVIQGQSLLVTPLTMSCNSFLYTSKDGKSDPFQGAVFACKGVVLSDFRGGSIPEGGKSIFLAK